MFDKLNTYEKSFMKFVLVGIRMNVNIPMNMNIQLNTNRHSHSE
jgi:hypothetical protein